MHSEFLHFEKKQAFSSIVSASEAVPAPLCVLVFVDRCAVGGAGMKITASHAEDNGGKLHLRMERVWAIP